MSEIQQMTTAQKTDLLIEWDLYSDSQRAPILKEFHKQFGDNPSQTDFLNFLRNKLQIDGYWEKIGMT